MYHVTSLQAAQKCCLVPEEKRRGASMGAEWSRGEGGVEGGIASASASASVSRALRCGGEPIAAAAGAADATDVDIVQSGGAAENAARGIVAGAMWLVLGAIGVLFRCAGGAALAACAAPRQIVFTLAVALGLGQVSAGPTDTDGWYWGGLGQTCDSLCGAGRCQAGIIDQINLYPTTFQFANHATGAVEACSGGFEYYDPMTCPSQGYTATSCAYYPGVWAPPDTCKLISPSSTVGKQCASGHSEVKLLCCCASSAAYSKCPLSQSHCTAVGKVFDPITGKCVAGGAAALSRWYVGATGASCSATCGSAINDVTRQHAVSTEAKFVTALKAPSAEADGRTTATCDTLTSSGDANAPSFTTSTMACYYDSSGRSTTDFSIGDEARLCCCLAYGEDASTMCPVANADCDVGENLWDIGSGRCVTQAVCAAKTWVWDTVTRECRPPASAADCATLSLLFDELASECVASIRSRWYRSGSGATCTAMCGSLNCASGRMDAVSTAAKVTNVFKALGALGRGGDACTSTSPESGSGWSEVPSFYSGQCAYMTDAQSSCDGSYSIADRVCCCLATSEAGAATSLCPVESADCTGGLTWDPASATCEDIPTMAPTTGS